MVTSRVELYTGSTVTVWLPTQLPSEYEIEAVPTETPVTTPLDTVATDVFELPQLPPVAAVVSVTLLPTQTSLGPDTVTGEEITVTGEVVTIVMGPQAAVAVALTV